MRPIQTVLKSNSLYIEPEVQQSTKSNSNFSNSTLKSVISKDWIEFGAKHSERKYDQFLWKKALNLLSLFCSNLVATAQRRITGKKPLISRKIQWNLSGRATAQQHLQTPSRNLVWALITQTTLYWHISMSGHFQLGILFPLPAGVCLERFELHFMPTWLNVSKDLINKFIWKLSHTSKHDFCSWVLCNDDDF